MVAAMSAVVGLALFWLAVGSSSTFEGAEPEQFTDASSMGSDDSQPRSAFSQHRADVPVLRDLAAEAKGRQRRIFRELAAKRNAELEADPEFQRLLEMDSDRKMALIDRDPVELARVRKAIGVPGGKISRRVLEKALVDPNPEVRLAALHEISLTMDEVPVDLLAPVVAGDPSAEVRLEALEIVAEDESADAVAVIRTALNDPDDDVRTEAEDLLDDWAEENY
jgi:hypothetical protein